MPVVLVCQACGKSFSVPPVRATSAKYCSNECAGPRRSLSSVKPKTALVCAACDKTFYEHGCHAGRRRFCSNACRNGDSQYRKEVGTRMEGVSNGMWSGGVTTHSDGYIYERCNNHPYASNGYVLQHRLVVERTLREVYPASPYLVRLGDHLYLSPAYLVHHKNEIRTDNRPENLQVLTNSEHQKLHIQLRKLRKER